MSKSQPYYFPHYIGARNDTKLIKIRRLLGAEGYGVYFMILEVLREQNNFRYPMELLPELEFDLRVTHKLLFSVITDYDLFEIDDQNNFFSPKLVEYLTPFLRKSERAKSAAEKRWEEFKNNSNANAYANAYAENEGKNVTILEDNAFAHANADANASENANADAKADAKASENIMQKQPFFDASKEVSNKEYNNSNSSKDFAEKFAESEKTAPLKISDLPKKEENPSVARPSPLPLNPNLDIQNKLTRLLPVEECMELFFYHNYFAKTRELAALSCAKKGMTLGEVNSLMERWGKAFNRRLLLAGEVERKVSGNDGWQKHFGNWLAYQDKDGINPDELLTYQDFQTRTKDIKNFNKNGRQQGSEKQPTAGGIPHDKLRGFREMVHNLNPDGVIREEGDQASAGQV